MAVATRSGSIDGFRSGRKMIWVGRSSVGLKPTSTTAKFLSKWIRRQPVLDSGSQQHPSLERRRSLMPQSRLMISEKPLAAAKSIPFCLHRILPGNGGECKIKMFFIIDGNPGNCTWPQTDVVPQHHSPRIPVFLPRCNGCIDPVNSFLHILSISQDHEVHPIQA